MNQLRTIAAPPLAPGETPAHGARRLSKAKRRAIVVCAELGILQRYGCRWRSANGDLFSGDTITGLRTATLISISRRSARLTSNGKWYARTLRSDIAAQGFTPAEGVELCAIGN